MLCDLHSTGPHSAVTLTSTGDDLSTYINANFINVSHVLIHARLHVYSAHRAMRGKTKHT